MVNIVRTMFGLDKKPEIKNKKLDDRFKKTSKFVRPIKVADKGEEE